MNEEHFTFHLQYKHSGTFAIRKYEEPSCPIKSENVRPHSSNFIENATPIIVNPVVKMQPHPATHSQKPYQEVPIPRRGFSVTPRARYIQPKFPEISVQNSMDQFGPTGKVSKKRVHLLRWTTFPCRTGWSFG